MPLRNQSDTFILHQFAKINLLQRDSARARSLPPLSHIHKSRSSRILCVCRSFLRQKLLRHLGLYLSNNVSFAVFGGNAAISY